MHVMAHTETREEKLEIRLTRSAKQILRTAALAQQRSVSEFALQSALARAEEILPDQRHFGLNKAQWEAFQKVLDAPSRPSRRLAKLLKEPSVLEVRGM
jgi:uncharacterized protein (DUF1778 family)